MARISTDCFVDTNSRFAANPERPQIISIAGEGYGAPRVALFFNTPERLREFAELVAGAAKSWDAKIQAEKDAGKEAAPCPST